jgi:hypothetical protein
MPEDHDEDVVRILQNCGDHAHAVRKRGERVESVRVTPLKEGKSLPPGSELVSLTPRNDAPGVFDVTSHAGPARVTSAKFRKGYDQVFGRKPDKSLN